MRDASTLAKQRLCRAQGMLDYRSGKLNNPDTTDIQKKHLNAEIASIAYMMAMTKKQLDADGIDYDGYEHYGRDLAASKQQ